MDLDPGAGDPGDDPLDAVGIIGRHVVPALR